MDMVTLKKTLWLAGLVCVMTPQAAHTQQFRLTVAGPVAANTPGFKQALFVARTDGCPSSAKPTIKVTGEGLVGGVRRSIVVEPMPLTQPGAYAVSRQGMTEGLWVVALTATCKEMTAGAIVPIGPHGFTRETSRFFPRPASSAEISDALTQLATNGGMR